MQSVDRPGRGDLRDAVQCMRRELIPGLLRVAGKVAKEMEMSELTEFHRAAIAQAPEASKNTVTRAFSGSASPRQAIKAMCLSCVGFIRADIKNCTARACPLYAYRPYQADDEKA